MPGKLLISLGANNFPSPPVLRDCSPSRYLNHVSKRKNRCRICRDVILIYDAELQNHFFFFYLKTPLPVTPLAATAVGKPSHPRRLHDVSARVYKQAKYTVINVNHHPGIKEKPRYVYCACARGWREIKRHALLMAHCPR